jgi:hypothetical protein
MAPEIYDLPKLHRGMLEVLGIKDADKLVPLPDDQKPRDPVAENMAVLKGEPVKAFFYQDHESHIKVHMSAMQDPIVMQLIGQNPKAPMIQAAMMAHVAEHVGYAYKLKIEQQLGMPLPPEDEKLPPEIEIQLSAMMAQAAQQVLQQSQAQAAQQQAQQQQQDPLIQMQQQELQLKQQELQLRQQEVQGKLQIEQQRLQMDGMAKMEQVKQADKKIQMDGMAKMEQVKQADKKIQMDALAKAGQLKQDKARQEFENKKLQVDALNKAGQHKMQKAQLANQAAQQKEKPEQ